MRKIILILILLIGILGALGFWFWNRNPYSKDIVKIEILGPAEADFSEEVEYTVKYKNNGNVRLEQASLIFEFPDNTLSGETLVKRKEVGPEEIGDIYPGDEKTYAFKGRLFGKEGDLKTANVWLSYQPKNLRAKYKSASSLTTKIKAVPLTFDFDLPSKVEANKDFDFSLNYFSMMDYPLSQITVKIEYPGGFELLDNKPHNFEKNEWDIALLNKAEGGRIEVKGRISAELGEHKIFKAQLGMWKEGEFILLKEINRGVEIVQPYLAVYQQINGQADYVASPGDLLHYEIFFRNVGEEPFTDLFLVSRLDGAGYDFSSVRTSDGQFQQGDNTILWDWHNVSRLKFLDQGEEGKVEFWVKLKNAWETQEKETVIKSTVLISKVKQELLTKVNSKLVLEQVASYEAGANPPKAGVNTIYNIFWEIKNPLNKMKNVKVKAVLPPNVKLTGSSHPGDNFAFDSQSREIVWLAGDLEGGSMGPTISFKIEIVPIMNQRGEKAVLAEQIRLMGEDDWTQRNVEQNLPSLVTPENISG